MTTRARLTGARLTGARFAGAIPVVLACLLASGCDQAPDPQADAGTTADADAGQSFIGRKVAAAIDKAGQELKTENIRIGQESRITINGRSYGSRAADKGLPKAEITPDGELLVDGNAVPATPAQREALLAYRRNLEGLALSGMAIGAQGADVAGTALTGIGQALFGGEEGRRTYEARIEAEAEKIKQEAYKLCALLPDLYDSQQSLATLLPDFAPYATMTPEDVEDCKEGIEAEEARAPEDAIKA